MESNVCRFVKVSTVLSKRKATFINFEKQYKTNDITCYYLKYIKLFK